MENKMKKTIITIMLLLASNAFAQSADSTTRPDSLEAPVRTSPTLYLMGDAPVWQGERMGSIIGPDSNWTTTYEDENRGDCADSLGYGTIGYNQYQRKVQTSNRGQRIESQWYLAHTYCETRAPESFTEQQQDRILGLAKTVIATPKGAIFTSPIFDDVYTNPNQEYRAKAVCIQGPDSEYNPQITVRPFMGEKFPYKEWVADSGDDMYGRTYYLGTICPSGSYLTHTSPFYKLAVEGGDT